MDFGRDPRFGLSQYSRKAAEMTELADVQDLGSCAIRREGSSPFFRMEDVYSFLISKGKNTLFLFCCHAYEKWSGGLFLSFAQENSSYILRSFFLEKRENIVYDIANIF